MTVGFSMKLKCFDGGVAHPCGGGEGCLSNNKCHVARVKRGRNVTSDELLCTQGLVKL